jgi:ABC-type sugar transport system ATPase subunit
LLLSTLPHVFGKDGEGKQDCGRNAGKRRLWEHWKEYAQLSPTLFVGVNGAGKLTLTKIMLGVYPCASGQILINGAETHFRNPEEAITNGVAMVYQELNLFPKMTIYENILMDRFLKTKLGLVDRKAGILKCQEFLDSIGIPLNAGDHVDELSLARQQLVEIAKNVYQGPKILILDEPSSSLSCDEQKILHDIIKNLKIKGLFILFINQRRV